MPEKTFRPSGLLQLIQEAKNNGSLWTEQALAELEMLTGGQYSLERRLEPSLYQPRGYEIQVRS